MPRWTASRSSARRARRSAPARARTPATRRFISALAAQIGINPYGDARFVDNDGTTSFTETNLSLRVSAQGQILLQVLQADPPVPERISGRARPHRGGAEPAQQPDRRRLRRRARLPAVLYRGRHAGRVHLRLLSFRRRGGGRQRHRDPLRRHADHAGQRPYRRFTLDLQPAALLPAAQAAACLPRGGTLRLLYAENAGGELAVGWQTN